MGTSEADRERLADRVGQAAFDALDRVRDDPGAMLADAWRRMGEAALAVAEPALLPPGAVAMERGRAERLIAVAQSGEQFDLGLDEPGAMPNVDFVAASEAFSVAIKALRPGDRDPPPEEGP